MKIGIIGATGAVGRQMIKSLEERNIDVSELRLFASPRSLGTKINCFGEDVGVQVVEDGCFKGLDYVLGAVEADLSEKYAADIVKQGAVFVDNSKAFRMDPNVPLVVPEINGEDARHNNGIISNPNCSTIITCMAVYPIAKLSPIKKMIASTYQAVSGAGMHGITELEEEIKALSEGGEVNPKTFTKQIAYNCIPLISSITENGYSSEEMKMQNEGRKIMHLPDLNVTCTCVRVPVFRSHAISVSLQCEEPLTLEAVCDAYKDFPGVKLTEDGFPTPLETSNQDTVFVGRIRKDLVFDGGVALWCCGDQIRKGAASNAVQIIEYLTK